MTIYPSWEYPNLEINKSLYDLVETNLVDKIKGLGRRTGFKLHEDEGVSSLITWIESLVPEAAYYFANGERQTTEQDAYECGFNNKAFKIRESWGVIYNEGEGVVEHNHFPYPISFVYSVAMPDESSPLILDKEEIFVPEGWVIFFMGHLFHGINPTKSDGRCIIAGNISYEFGSN